MKKKNRTLGIFIEYIVILCFIITLARGNIDSPDTLMAILFLLISIVAMITINSKKNAGKTGKKAAENQKKIYKKDQKQINMEKPLSFLQHEDESMKDNSEKTTVLSGKNKYIEQINGYLKNGLIEKEEYKILREKYENLNLPEDYR